MPFTLYSLPVTFAATGPTGLWSIFFLPAAVLAWFLVRGLLRSEKVEGGVQPVLWFFAGTGAVGVVLLGIYLTVREYSRYGLRVTQDGVVLLALLGMLAVAGGLLWVARTTEGSRILGLIWRFYRYGSLALGLTLLVIYIFFGFPHRH